MWWDYTDINFLKYHPVPRPEDLRDEQVSDEAHKAYNKQISAD